jgi:hypothetical protein
MIRVSYSVLFKWTTGCCLILDSASFLSWALCRVIGIIQDHLVFWELRGVQEWYSWRSGLWGILWWSYSSHKFLALIDKEYGMLNNSLRRCSLCAYSYELNIRETNSSSLSSFPWPPNTKDRWGGKGNRSLIFDIHTTTRVCVTVLHILCTTTCHSLRWHWHLALLYRYLFMTVAMGLHLLYPQKWPAFGPRTGMKQRLLLNMMVSLCLLNFVSLLVHDE